MVIARLYRVTKSLWLSDYADVWMAQARQLACHQVPRLITQLYPGPCPFRVEFRLHIGRVVSTSGDRKTNCGLSPLITARGAVMAVLKQQVRAK
jgi:hypothetical protein